jgi:hypothetical protein
MLCCAVSLQMNLVDPSQTAATEALLRTAGTSVLYAPSAAQCVTHQRLMVCRRAAVAAAWEGSTRSVSHIMHELCLEGSYGSTHSVKAPLLFESIDGVNHRLDIS